MLKYLPGQLLYSPFRQSNPAIAEVREALRKYEESDDIQTVNDLADDLEQLDNLPPDLADALETYRAAIQQ